MSIQDFALEQDNYGLYDLKISDKQFESVAGLETAVSFQLGIDRRSSRQEIGDARQRQGWIGDLLTKREGYEVGSLIYLKRQARNTPGDRAEIAAYADDALTYLVAIGAAERITARAIGNQIEGTITVRSDDVNRYSRLWRETNAV